MLFCTHLLLLLQPLVLWLLALFTRTEGNPGARVTLTRALPFHAFTRQVVVRAVTLALG